MRDTYPSAGEVFPPQVSKSVPDHRERERLTEGLLPLYAELEHINAMRFPNGPHVLPPEAYGRACLLVARLRKQHKLPFVVLENENTRVGEAAGPAELLRQPYVAELRFRAQALALMPRGEEEERELQGAMEMLRDSGVYFGVLVSDRNKARVYYSHGQPLTHSGIRGTLMGQREYEAGYPCTSGMLVRREDSGMTFVTDEARMIWPQHLVPSRIGSMPAIRAGMEDLSGIQPPVSGKDSSAPLIVTAEGHLLYTENERDIMARQAKAHHDYNKSTYYK